MRHTLNPETLTVQSFSTQAMADGEGYDTYKIRISDVSHSGVCTDTGVQAAWA
ncbi:MAG TPA: hypothetical protein VFJ82_08135 [Longimicrobium sp.]|nr:hypothetical protein [Longimicrobium sp.]